eukprot:scaffold39444_cov16-Tisochrysis_lutea.AAC.2
MDSTYRYCPARWTRRGSGLDAQTCISYIDQFQPRNFYGATIVKLLGDVSPKDTIAVCQRLWPEHCIQHTQGWELSKGLGIHIEGDYSKEKAEAATLLPAATTHSPQTEMFVLRKGQLPNLDACE